MPAGVENGVCEEFLYDIKGGLTAAGLRAALRAVLGRPRTPARNRGAATDGEFAHALLGAR